MGGVGGNGRQWQEAMAGSGKRQWQEAGDSRSLKIRQLGLLMEQQLINKYLTIYPDKGRTFISVGSDLVVACAQLYKDCLVYEPDDVKYAAVDGLSLVNVQLRQHAMYNKISSGSLVDGKFVKVDNGEHMSHVLDYENLHIVDFLAIGTDVLQVLEGGVNLLQRCKPLLWLGLVNSEVLTFISALGYKGLSFDCSSSSNFFYIPEVVENIEKNNIFCFWTGTNIMTHNRIGCLYNLRTQTDSNIILVTVDNLSTYIKPEAPLHEAYQYLSETHKCDYLRTYFMHHYGGGYTDIKSPTGSWAPAFQQMRDDPMKIINGYHEQGEHAIAYEPAASKWGVLCGNGAYIVRPRTAFTYAWYGAMMDKMDEKVAELRLHPATRVEDAKEWGGGYPLEWCEMLGRIFHRILLDYVDGFLLYSTPTPSFDWYR